MATVPPRPPGRQDSDPSAEPPKLAPSLTDLARMAERIASPAGQGKGRTVVRFDRDDLARLGTLRAALSCLTTRNVSRAAVIRVLVGWALDMLDAAASAPKEGGAS